MEGSMKLLKMQSIALSTLVLATPALAQTNDQAVSEGAGVIAWILVGLIGGYLASRMVNKTGEGIVRDIILGIVGGIVGGVIFRVLGGHGVTGCGSCSLPEPSRSPVPLALKARCQDGPGSSP